MGVLVEVGVDVFVGVSVMVGVSVTGWGVFVGVADNAATVSIADQVWAAKVSAGMGRLDC